MGQAFVSDPDAIISPRLVSVVFPKRLVDSKQRLLKMPRDSRATPMVRGGLLIRGKKKIEGTNAAKPKVPRGNAAKQKSSERKCGETTTSKKKRARPELFSSYEVTPVTAKHLLAPLGDDDDEGDRYDRTNIQFPGFLPMFITMPDGGCTMTEYIGVVRPATEERSAVHTEDNDYSFGKMEVTPEKGLTSKDAVSLSARPFDLSSSGGTQDRNCRVPYL